MGCEDGVKVFDPHAHNGEISQDLRSKFTVPSQLHGKLHPI